MSGGADATSDRVRRLVLVVAISRSGTSLFTGILAQLGFSVPQPEVKANDTNPRGFGEPRWVVDFHTRLLRELRVRLADARPAAWEITAAATNDEAVVAELRSWLEVQFVGTDNVVVKDPRIGWFLPLWRRCAGDLRRGDRGPFVLNDCWRTRPGPGLVWPAGNVAAASARPQRPSFCFPCPRQDSNLRPAA